MVSWTSDTLLAVLAYGSTLVATLRAGSRVLYLMEHNQIDVMDGPLILGPNDVGKTIRNETTSTLGEVSPMWELASVFQESVRFALDPDRMEYRVFTVDVPQEGKELQHDEPYSLSPFPKPKRKVNETVVVTDFTEQSTELLETTENVEILTEDIVSESSHDRLNKRTPFFPRLSSYLPRFSNYVPQVPSFRGVLSKVPLMGPWADSEASDEDDSFSFDDVETDEWDFDYCMSTDIPYNTTTSTTEWAEITAYAPSAFADLRSRFGIGEEAFRQSILESGPFVSFQSNSKGAARVGGVFFFTRDGAYMVKTIKKEEARTLLQMLPKYHKYMKRNGHRSLLTRFCGMYGVSLGTSGTSSGRDRSWPQREHENIIVVMNSVFPAAGSHFISERFDLKGSTVGRQCSQEEKDAKGKNAILKDLDLAREVELIRSLTPTTSKHVPTYGFHLGATVKSSLLAQLRRDVRLLVSCGVMDYSLLVGVVNMDRHQLDSESMRALELSEIQESRMEMARRAREKKSFERFIVSSIVAPFRIMIAPPLFLARRLWSEMDSVFSSILTLPLPYYGAENPGVNGGTFSVIEGQRSGSRAIYFMGLIDFLQPWTTRKVLERRLKGVLGYDVHAISCVSPEEYASRFLDFIATHVS